MKEFIWTKCLNDGPGVSLVLKKNEEDFIVREGGLGGLLNIGDSLEGFISLLDDLPGVSEKLLKNVESIEERKTGILLRITEINDKDQRRRVHKAYSLHPFIYTKTVKNKDGTSDILIVFDTHHKMHTFSATLSKKGKTTQDAVEVLARALKIQSHQVKYAGNKDKKAITTQRISISGVSYLELRKAAKQLQERVKELASDEHTKTNEQNKNSSQEVRNSSVFDSTSREISDRELENEKIRTVRGSEIIDGVSEVLAKTAEHKVAPQTDEEYLKAARSIEEGIVISNIERVEGTIKLGDLEKNRFYISMEVTSGKERVEKRVKELKEKGFPNYYGSQRFGYGLSNQLVGEALLQKDYKKAVEQILKNLEALEHSPRVKEALEFVHKNDYESACRALPGKFQTEKLVLRLIGKNVPHKVIFNRIRRENRLIYLHSYQSKLFNDLLQNRLENGLNEQEYVTEEFVGSVTSKEEIEKKIKISNSPQLSDLVLPLFPNEEVVESGSKKKEAQALGLKGGFRKAIIIPENLTYTISENILEIVFNLPPGTYATMLVKELSRNSVDEIG